jgi:hypothetical protein
LPKRDSETGAESVTEHAAPLRSAQVSVMEIAANLQTKKDDMFVAL